MRKIIQASNKAFFKYIWNRKQTTEAIGLLDDETIKCLLKEEEKDSRKAE